MSNIIIPFRANLLESGTPPFTNTYSLDFDGVDDYVGLSTSTGLNFSNDFTLSAWVKTSAIGDNQFIIDASTSAASGHGYSLRLLTTGAVRFWSYSAIQSIDSTTTLLANTWYHICATHNRSGLENKIYINGVLDASGVSGTFNPTSMANLRIGSSVLLGFPFNGNIDEPCFFNRKLIQSEITTLATAPTVDLTSLNPIAWYRNGDNGSWNSPQWLIPSNENKDKVSNYSFEFDRVDDDFTSGDLSALVDNKSKLSISFWVNLADATEINRITGKMSDPASTSKWLGVNGNITNGLNFVVSDGSLAYAEANNVLTNNTWHHIVCVFDGTQVVNVDRAKIYVDGVDETQSIIGTLPSTTYDFTLEATTTLWYIGQSGIQLGINQLRGKLDEYAIYSDVSLTPSQVNDIYNGGTPNDLSTLSVTPDLWFRMGEEANFTSNWLVDNSALTNYSKRSFQFDGVDDYINLGDIAALNNTTNFTYSGWYNQPTLDVRGTMLNSGYNSSNQEFIFFYTWVDGRMILQIGDSGVNPFASFDYSLYVTAGQWFHFAYVYNGNGITEADKVQIYINGAPITLTFSGTMHSSTPVGANITKISSTTTDAWGGKIDEAAFFDYSLTQQNVTDIYNGGNPTDLSLLATPPTNWYRMGEEASFDGTNWTVPDNVGSNNGTSNAMTVDALVGEAPNYSGGGISNGMTIEDRVGNAPNSENNALSYNMESVDRTTDVPT